MSCISWMHLHEFGLPDPPQYRVVSLVQGQQRGYHESYRGVPIDVNLLKKVRLEIGVNEDFVEPTINAIAKGARTGEIGDGKIFVVDLGECVRIRTGETGTTAIG